MSKPVPQRLSFPHLSEELRLRRLETPAAGKRPAVVIDTDAANEIDDQFALAWAFTCADRLRVKAVLAAPCSFEHRRHEVIRARVARDNPVLASAEDHEFLALHADKLAHWERQGWDPRSVSFPGFCTPENGMQRSRDEIIRIWQLAGAPDMGEGFNSRSIAMGSTRYVDASQAPEASDATRLIIELAQAQLEDDPLYVLAIGCLTNVAQALRTEPELVRRIVVVWTAGYPSHAPHRNRAFNLEQDVAAVQTVFECGVPLVYLPGYHVGAQLRLSLPEAERYLKGRGPLADALWQLYTHNPLWPLLGIDSAEGNSWVIWDLINLAWLMNPQWVPSTMVLTPGLGGDLHWRPNPKGQRMREAHGVQRDAIFNDLFQRVAGSARESGERAKTSASPPERNELSSLHGSDLIRNTTGLKTGNS